MNDIAATEMICEMAANREPVLKAFSALTKGPDGVKGLKREDFEKQYNQLLASPLLRKVQLRQVRENSFKNQVAEAVMQVDPPTELDAVKIAGLLENSRQAPRSLPALFIAVGPLLPSEKLLELEALAATLYPEIYPVAAVDVVDEAAQPSSEGA
jgi:hypothetical protein